MLKIAEEKVHNLHNLLGFSFCVGGQWVFQLGIFSFSCKRK